MDWVGFGAQLSHSISSAAVDETAGRRGGRPAIHNRTPPLYQSTPHGTHPSVLFGTPRVVPMTRRCTRHSYGHRLGILLASLCGEHPRSRVVPQAVVSTPAARPERRDSNRDRLLRRKPLGQRDDARSTWRVDGESGRGGGGGQHDTRECVSSRDGSCSGRRARTEQEARMGRWTVHVSVWRRPHTGAFASFIVEPPGSPMRAPPSHHALFAPALAAADAPITMLPIAALFADRCSGTPGSTLAALCAACVQTPRSSAADGWRDRDRPGTGRRCGTASRCSSWGPRRAPWHRNTPPAPCRPPCHSPLGGTNPPDLSG
eukprot:ctg_91.g24